MSSASLSGSKGAIRIGGPVKQMGMPSEEMPPQQPAGGSTGFVVLMLVLACVTLGIDILTDPAVSDSLYGAIGMCPYATIALGLFTVYRNTRGEFARLLLPSGTAPMVLMAIFGVRPLLYTIDENFVFHGWSTLEGARIACQAGLLFMIAFVVGYTIWESYSKKEAESDKPVSRAAPSLILGNYAIGRVAPVVLLLLLLWYVLYVLWTGRPDIVIVLLAGRSQMSRQLLSGAPAVLSLLPVCAGILLCYTRMLYERVKHYTFIQELMWWGLVLLAALPALGQGTRRFQIPVVVAAGFAVLSRQRFPAQNAIAFSLAGVTFLILAATPFIRSAGARREGESVFSALQRYIEEEGVSGVLDQFFLSYDTEMFDYVSWMAIHIGKSVEYGFGRSGILDFIVNPLPAGMLIDELWSDTLLIQMTGLDCTNGPCPVPSVVGVAYADFGLISVLLAGVTLGMLSMQVEQMYGGRDVEMLFFTVVIAFGTVITRGSAAISASLAAQCFIVCLIFWWFLLRPKTESRM